MQKERAGKTKLQGVYFGMPPNSLSKEVDTERMNQANIHQQVSRKKNYFETGDCLEGRYNLRLKTCRHY